MIRFIELFCGIGGFRLGLERTGKFKCVWANDTDKYACQIYRKNFGKGELHEGNIRKVKADDIPDHDLLTAGFPCQSFSIAGKRGGFEDTRGTLFYEIARVLAAKRPPLLLLENVKGLLSHDNGNTFGTILTTLSSLGYILQWQILNSKDFGVPQNRERVFIVGHLGKGSARQVFPVTTATRGSIKISMRSKHQQDIVYKPEGILNLPAGTHGSTPHLTKIVDMTKRCGYKEKNNFACLDANYYKSIANQERPAVLENNLIRRLTPIECERLQGFPDGWTKGVSDTQRYKCLGNAVTVNVIEAIGKRLL